MTAPAVRPLPPPIMVSTPARETVDDPGSSDKPPYAAAAGSTIRAARRRRPNPVAPPLDLRAEVGGAVSARSEPTPVAEDVLSAAKSVFHAVLPK